MRLIQKKSGRFTYLYAIKSYRTEDGKSTTKVVEKFGTVEELQESLDGEDPVKWAEERVAEMNAREKEDKEEIVVKLKPGVLVGKGEQRSYNGGYLFLQKIYYELGLDYVCKKIETYCPGCCIHGCCTRGRNCHHWRTRGSSSSSRRRTYIRCTGP